MSDMFGGRYRVGNIVSDSGLSVVVAAHDLQLNVKVAIEMFHGEMFDSAKAVAHSTWMARRATRIKSEHMLRILDVGVLETGAPYVVMEPFDGMDLAGWLRQHGALPIEQAVDFLLQACHALAEAHSQGIVHRDIKPANLLMVERSGAAPSIKVFGWSLSTTLGSSATGQESAHGHAQSATTEARAIVGTPLYMSPEQARGAPDCDERADIWSLGVTLCELVTGGSPFEDGSTGQFLLSLISGAPMHFSDSFRRLPKGRETVIAKCLEKDRARRYQNVAGLAVALLEFGSERAKPLVHRICALPKRLS
jgi:serine/threonine-protein kinase